jgi:hypothetical protein
MDLLCIFLVANTNHRSEIIDRSICDERSLFWYLYGPPYVAAQFSLNRLKKSPIKAKTIPTINPISTPANIIFILLGSIDCRGGMLDGPIIMTGLKFILDISIMISLLFLGLTWMSLH